MHRVVSVAFALALLVTSAPSVVRAGAQAPSRGVYITLVDKQGQPVPGLTAADLTLKEGGRDREIASVVPATEKMRIAIMIEETLVTQGSVRSGIADFSKRMVPNAEIALIVAGQRNTTVVPYTSDLNVIIGGINNLPLSVRQQTNHVAEGIYEIARSFQKEPAARRVIVAVALDLLQASTEEPQNVLNQIKDSGALMYVVSVEGGSSAGSLGSMSDMSGRAQVLGDGPKQSGGRQIAVNALTAIPRSLQQVADDLSGQYLVSYTLPEGTKPSDRLSVSTKKRDVTLRAPTRIPNR